MHPFVRNTRLKIRTFEKLGKATPVFAGGITLESIKKTKKKLIENHILNT